MGELHTDEPEFRKYHGLGNDYLVIDPSAVPDWKPTVESVRAICDRNYGPGSDGILFGPLGDGAVPHGPRQLAHPPAAGRGREARGAAGLLPVPVQPEVPEL